MKTLIFLTTLIISNLGLAAEHPGEEIFDENCASGCHIHTTDDLFKANKRGFTTKAKLAGMVSQCVSATGVAIFPDDEELIVQYLNQKYYHLQ